MNGKIIILTGYVATGKTTFSHVLSKKFNIMCFNKDIIKIVLEENLPINNREEKSRLSVTAYNLIIYVLENFMSLNMPIIIESNFKPAESAKLKELIAKYNYKPLTILMIGDLNIIHKRFIEREDLPERGEANRSNGIFDEFSKFAKSIMPLGDFDIGGKKIKIDTSDFSKVNFTQYIDEIKAFLSNNDEA